MVSKNFSRRGGIRINPPLVFIIIGALSNIASMHVTLVRTRVYFASKIKTPLSKVLPLVAKLQWFGPIRRL